MCGKWELNTHDWIVRRKFNRLWTEWDRFVGNLSEVNKFESGLLGLRGLYAPSLDTCSVYS